MDILFHVSTVGGARLLAPLARACRRRGASFAAFFTHEGVRGLLEADVQAALAGSRAVVCEESWRRFCAGTACPAELGSQTVNSALMGEARKVVSL